MANVLSNPSHVAQIGYNGFDMSNLLKFSSTTGELLPVYYDILYPGDKVTCSTELKTRLMPMEASAMANIEEHIEWFFVPLDQIWSLFSQWYNQINDVSSSLFDLQNLRSDFPYIDRVAFLQFYKNAFQAQDMYFRDPDINGSFTGTSFRLMELLGIPLQDYSSDEGTSWQMAINPMFACVYQKIYFDYYRISDRESNDPEAYNLDNLSTLDSTPSAALVKKYFTLRYRPRQKDFFTHNYVSPLFGAASLSSWIPADNVGATSGLVNAFNQWLVPTDLAEYAVNYPDNPQSGMSPNASKPTFVGVASVTTNQKIINGMSPTAIRTAFATQKLLEITRRAGKHIDDQTLAHFGVKVDRRVSGEVLYLGGSTSTIQIGDVLATATTEGSALGQVGGKGYGFGQGKQIHFENDFPCAGVLMAIYSACPAVDYRQLGLDKLHTYINLGDFYRPEFDNLGMQPLFNFQRHAQLWDEAGADNYEVNGWQFRFMESKLKYNRVCGSLARTLYYWTTAYNPSHYNTPSNHDAYTQPYYLNYYLCSPFALNDIMLKAYDFSGIDNIAPSITSDSDDLANRYAFDSDPMLHELYFNVKKASKMSSFGLEQL